MKVIVKLVSSLPKRLTGLNYYSNKVLNVNQDIKENVIYILSRQSFEAIFRCTQRERCELYYMKKGYNYRKAHRIAKEIECLGLEFPQELEDLVFS